MLVHATYVQTELDPVTSVGSRNRDNQVVTHLNSHLLPKCRYFQMKIQIKSISPPGGSRTIYEYFSIGRNMRRPRLGNRHSIMPPGGGADQGVRRRKGWFAASATLEREQDEERKSQCPLKTIYMTIWQVYKERPRKNFLFHQDISKH